jgi:putative ABC transport system ATP-binding protein
MTLFSELNADGITIVLVTHESDIAAYASRQIRFLDGRIVQDTRSKTIASIASAEEPD